MQMDQQTQIILRIVPDLLPRTVETLNDLVVQVSVMHVLVVLPQVNVMHVLVVLPQVSVISECHACFDGVTALQVKLFWP